MENMDYWRLCDDLSIVQAALLIVGQDPGLSQDCVENREAESKPVGYEAAKTALSNALKKGDIQGRWVKFPQHNMNGNFDGWEEDSIDIKASVVSVSSLCEFLAKRGYKEGFFAQREQLVPDYLDIHNSRYAPKLAAAVKAWEAVASDPEFDQKGKTPKQALEIWLRKNASEFDLTNADGNPNETGIEEIAKVTNWKPEGGVSKTPTFKPTPPKNRAKT